MAGQTFLEFYRKQAGFIPDEHDFDDTTKLKHVGDPDKTGADIWLWKPGTKKERSFDAAPFFPIDNGGEPPYFRQRHQPERYEVGQYFRYQNWCRRNDEPVGPFTPIPLPTPEALAEQDEDE